MHSRKIKLSESEILLLLILLSAMSQSTGAASGPESKESSAANDSENVLTPTIDLKTISPRSAKPILIISRNKLASSWRRAKYIERAEAGSRRFIVQSSELKQPVKLKVFSTVSPEDFPLNIEQSSKSITLSSNISSSVSKELHSKEFEIEYHCEQPYINSKRPWMKISISLHSEETGKEIAGFSFYKFCSDVKIKKWDISLGFIIIIAILSVSLFAKWGSLTTKTQDRTNYGNISYNKYNNNDFTDFESYGVNLSDSGQKITVVHCFYFILICSFSLLFLYYFLKYVELLLNSCFTGVSFIALWGLTTATLIEIKSGEGKQLIREIEKHSEHLIVIGASLCLSVAYFLTKHWVLNNIIALSLVFFALKAVKLPNLYTGALLIGLSFFYDIFWVYFSKNIFGNSVMDAVASEIKLPLKLEMPIFQEYPYPLKSMLGLGDLLLPGLFINICHRIDVRLKSRGSYYFSAVVGFSFGLLSSLVSLVILDHAQPALLYIAPFLLGIVGINATLRGDGKVLWLLELQ